MVSSFVGKDTAVWGLAVLEYSKTPIDYGIFAAMVLLLSTN